MSGHPRYNGRAKKVREYLVAHPNGVTLHDLIAAVEPTCKLTNMAATVYTLIGAKKIQAKYVRRVRKFFPSATISVDGRIASNAVPKRKPAAANDAAPIARKQRGVIAPPATVPITAAFEPPRRLGTHTAVDAKEQERAELAANVAAFVAGGGVIQKLKHGEGSQTLYGFHQPRNEAARNEPPAATPAATPAYGRGNEIPAHRRRASRAA